MSYRFAINDKVTWLSAARNMTGVIFKRFPAVPLIPENRYAIKYGKSKRVSVIAESHLRKIR